MTTLIDQPTISTDELRVLLLAPFGRDRELLADRLARNGMQATVCTDLDELLRQAAEAAGAMIIAQEVFRPIGGGAVERIVAALRHAPSWSHIPLILLTSDEVTSEETWRQVHALDPVTKTTLLERPVREVTLLSAAHAALQARRRQYQVRDYLREREEASEALRISEERLRMALRGANAGVWSLDVATGATFWSDEFEPLYGFDASKPRTLDSWIASVLPEDRAEVKAAFRKRLESDETEFRQEFRIQHPARGVRWILDLGRIERDANGKALRFRGINIDITDRKQAEAALRAKETELELIADTTPLILTRCSRDLHYRFVNRAAAALFDLTPDQIIDRPIVEIIGEKSFAIIRPHIERVLRGESVEFETTIPYRDGPSRWVHVNYIPDSNARGEIEGWIASIVDITDRKHAEEALRESERNLADFFENAAIGLFWFGADGTILRTNRAFSEMLGYGAGALEGRSLSEIMADTKQVQQILRRVRAGMVLHDLEVMLRARDESIRHVVIDSNALWDDGELVHVRCFVRDVTEQWKAQQAVRQSERLYRGIGESINYGVWVCDPTGKNIYASESFLNLVGLTQKECSDFGWGTVLHPDDAGPTIAAWKECVASGEFWEREHRVRGVDGKWHPILARGGPICDEDGRIRYWAGINLDISGLKLAQEQIARSETRKSAILESALDCIITMDAKGRIVDFNPAAERTFGVESEDVIGKRVGDVIIPPRFRAAHQQGLRRFLETGESAILGKRIEMPALRADGTEFPAELAITAIDVDRGAPFFTAYLRDVTDRIAADQALRESEERFRDIFETAGVSVLVEDFNLVKQEIDKLRASGVTDFRTYFADHPEFVKRALDLVHIVDVNDETVHLFRAKDKAALLHSLADVFTPETDAVFVEELVALAEGFETVRAEAPLRTLDGQPLHVVFTLRFSPRTEDYSRVIVTLTDVTESKQAEKDISRFKFISDNANDAHFFIHRSGRLLYVNKVACEHLGYTEDELMQLKVVDIDPAYSGTRVRELFAAQSEGPVPPFESELRRRDGSMMPVEVSVTGITFDNEPYLFAVARDISLRKEQERERAQLAAIVESSSDAIIGKTLDGFITNWNEGAEKTYGYTEKEVIGRPVSMLIPQDLSGELANIMKRVRDGTRIPAFETERLTKDGRRIHVSLTVSPVYDAAGKLIAASAIARDITKRKLADEELASYRERLEELVQDRTIELEESHEMLRLSERMAALGTLSAGLGHDMGNLLLPVRLRLDAMRAKGLPAEYKEDVDSIQQCAEYLQRLANGLRLLALDPNESSQHKEPTNVQTWWEEVAALFKTALPQRVSLLGEIPPDVPPVRLAKHRLTQMVLNLVQNAGDAIGDDTQGTVKVWAQAGEGGETIVLGVTDDGPGMTPEVRRRCLEPFFTSKTRELSTGLGLALVHGIVQKAAGSLHLETELGKGTTFRIELPARPMQQSSSGASDAEGKSLAILTLRDPRLRGYIASVLHPYEIRITSDPSAQSVRVASIWVTDADSEHINAADRFARKNRPTLLLGDSPHGWKGGKRTKIISGEPRPSALLAWLREQIDSDSTKSS